MLHLIECQGGLNESALRCGHSSPGLQALVMPENRGKASKVPAEMVGRILEKAKDYKKNERPKPASFTSICRSKKGGKYVRCSVSS
jgi:hypothetical protein